MDDKDKDKNPLHPDNDIPMVAVVSSAGMRAPWDLGPDRELSPEDEKKNRQFKFTGF